MFHASSCIQLQVEAAALLWLCGTALWLWHCELALGEPGQEHLQAG